MPGQTPEERLNFFINNKDCSDIPAEMIVMYCACHGEGAAIRSCHHMQPAACLNWQLLYARDEGNSSTTFVML